MSAALSLPQLARALGGEVASGQVLAPGPNHSSRDRSLAVRPSSTAPGGYVVTSHCGDSWQTCRDHVDARLGIPTRREPYTPTARSSARTRVGEPAPAVTVRDEGDEARRIARAASLWGEGRDPRGTLVELYLAARGLALPDEVAGEALRFHPACPWRDEETGETIRVPAMLAVMRDVLTDELRAIHRTRLGEGGTKLGRRMLGPSGGCAVKLDGDDAVTGGLVVGEGIETCLAARQLGFAPAWAMGSAGAIGTLPVLPGLEGLTLLAETDDGGANARAIEACGPRWHQAGRDVVIIEPTRSGDMNDALREPRA